jgi:hypothetical protein
LVLLLLLLLLPPPPSSSLPLLAGGMLPLSHPASLYNHKNRGDINHVSFTSPHRSFLIQIYTRILKTQQQKKETQEASTYRRERPWQRFVEKKMEVDREEDVAKCKQADERQRRGEQTMEEDSGGGARCSL